MKLFASSYEGGNWNLKIGRNPHQVVREIAQLMTEYQLAFLNVCEASTYVATLARESEKGGILYEAGLRAICFPDSDIPGRETAIIVRKLRKGGPRVSGKRLHTITNVEWERDPHNRSLGLHPGRRSVSLKIGFFRDLATHTPPGPYGDRFPLRRAANLDAFKHHERIAKRWTQKRFLPVGRAAMIGDWNRLPNDAVVTQLCRATGWKVFGSRIDWALAWRVTFSNVRRVEFGHSDHQPVLFTVSKA